MQGDQQGMLARLVCCPTLRNSKIQLKMRRNVSNVSWSHEGSLESSQHAMQLKQRLATVESTQNGAARLCLKKLDFPKNSRWKALYVSNPSACHRPNVFAFLQQLSHHERLDEAWQAAERNARCTSRNSGCHVLPPLLRLQVSHDWIETTPFASNDCSIKVAPFSAQQREWLYLLLFFGHRHVRCVASAGAAS